MSRNGSGLSRPNFDLYGPHGGHSRCARRFEVQFQRLSQVCESLVFRLPLTGYVEFEALRDVPFSLSPYGRGKLSLHASYCSTVALVLEFIRVAPPPSGRCAFQGVSWTVRQPSLCMRQTVALFPQFQMAAVNRGNRTTSAGRLDSD